MRNWKLALVVTTLAIGFTGCETAVDDSGVCVADATCDDANPCTNDRCDVATGKCVNEVKRCDDGDPCTTDSCVFSTGTCVNLPKTCDDDNACTIDSCDDEGGCQHANRICDDANLCTTDSCLPDKGCANAPVDCDDGNPCSINRCDSKTGECAHEDLACDDGNPCTADACDPDLGACTHIAKDCDDDDLCTQDSCNASTGQCRHAAKDCDDGNLCSLDTCDPGTGECSHTAVACDDGEPCTNDSCNPFSGQCSHTAKKCDDADPCTIDACDAGTGECNHTARDCDDANPCTVDLCEGGICKHGPVSCDDSNPCTNDSCDAGTGICVSTAKDCGDANACTADACDPTTGACTYGPVAVDDGNPCTVDACNPASGQITHTARTCDDNDPCTIDACDSTTGQCTALAKDCDDGNSCTLDTCEGGACLHAPKANGSECDDGLEWTVDEVCATGVCVGTSIAAQTMFRVDSLTLAAPLVAVDLGEGAVELNDVLGAFLTAYLDTFRWGGFVVSFDPLALDWSHGSVSFGEGACTFEGAEADACALVPWGRQADLAPVQTASQGTCGAGVDAPCFATPTGAFDLAAILPDLFVNPVGDASGSASGAFAGTAALITGIGDGTVRVFAPRAAVLQVAEGLTLPLAGGDVPLTDLLTQIPVNTHLGVVGWDVEIGFTATHVDLLTLPGGCNNDPSSCNDSNACTTDVCNPLTGLCEFPPEADGTMCDDGDALTTGDMCQAGVCGGTPLPPAVFRVHQVVLEAPVLSYDFGAGVVEANELLSALVTAALDDFSFGGMVVEFEPFFFGANDVSLRFGEGACTFDGPEADACALLPTGDSAAFASPTLSATTACSASPATPAPCFVTPSGLFDLADLLPDVFPLDVGTVSGRALGSFAGSPVEGIANGTIEAFVPAAALEALTYSFGGQTLVGADLVAGNPTITVGGVPGYQIILHFEADRVDFLELPMSGCNADAGLCQDNNPCTWERCNPFTTACEGGPEADGTACSDGLNLTTGDACHAGACSGTVPASPLAYLIDDLALLSPVIRYDFGGGVVEVNDLVDTFLTASLDLFEAGGALVAFGPGAQVRFGEAFCTTNAAGTPVACDFLDDGHMSSLGDTRIGAAGPWCGMADGYCYATGMGSIDLAGLLAEFFPTDVGAVQGYSTGAFTSATLAGIHDGVVHGFLPQAAAGYLTLDLPAGSVTAADLLALTPTTVHEGQVGWWLDLGYNAHRILYLVN